MHDLGVLSDLGGKQWDLPLGLPLPLQSIKTSTGGGVVGQNGYKQNVCELNSGAG